MLKVEVGYILFNFAELESTDAYLFAKMARDHLDPDEKRDVVMRFVNTIKKEEEES